MEAIGEDERGRLRTDQLAYLNRLSVNADLEALASEGMWRPGPIVHAVTRFESIFEALNAATVRYVVVGGVAVVLHGHARLTADLDLAVDLAPEPAGAAIRALAALGLRPAAPVDPQGFADAQQRERWISERNMRVFTMRDPDDPLRQVDLFVDEPIPFEALWERSEEVALEQVSVRIASIPDLIRMKELAGRPLDRGDILELRAIEESRQDD